MSEFIEGTNRWWTKTYQSSYVFEWESRSGDLLESHFEKVCKLNHVELPVYGEDLEEILTNNAYFIKANNLLK